MRIHAKLLGCIKKNLFSKGLPAYKCSRAVVRMWTQKKKQHLWIGQKCASTVLAIGEMCIDEYRNISIISDIQLTFTICFIVVNEWLYIYQYGYCVHSKCVLKSENKYTPSCNRYKKVCVCNYVTHGIIAYLALLEDIVCSQIWKDGESRDHNDYFSSDDLWLISHLRLPRAILMELCDELGPAPEWSTLRSHAAPVHR